MVFNQKLQVIRLDLANIIHITFKPLSTPP